MEYPFRQTYIDDGSTTPSNCDSLSPRMSDNGLSPGLGHLGTSGAWQNEPDQREITYFEDENEDTHEYSIDSEEDDTHTHSTKEEEDIDITVHTHTQAHPYTQWSESQIKVI